VPVVVVYLFIFLLLQWFENMSVQNLVNLSEYGAVVE
jgi:hypothetical protein